MPDHRIVIDSPDFGTVFGVTEIETSPKDEAKKEKRFTKREKKIRGVILS